MLWLKDIISILYPELLVLIALVIAIFLCTTRFKDIIWIISIMFMITGIVHILKHQFNLIHSVQILNGAFIADDLSNIFRLLTLFIAVFIILASVKYSEGFTHRGEFMIILLSSVLGIMFLVSANDLVTLFVALETLGLSSILLVGYSKYDLRSNEASLKYLLNSASASAIFLFGLSILYGLTGSTQFYEIKYKLIQLLDSGDLNKSIITISIILITSGLAFKLASAPFHMWSPDVYEGAPTPVTAFLSTASKAAGIAISIRILFSIFNFASNLWQPILIILSGLSMIIGNFIALGEAINKASIKRLMAYSSIAQVGYILIGLSLARENAVSASVFYLLIYVVMNIGAFLCIIAFGNEANSDSISDYSGLAKKRPLLALAFSICLFNLAGLPIPPAGFIAKFILFKASFESGLVGILLGGIALATTILSIYYYSYIVKLMVIDEPSKAVLKIDSNRESLGKSVELNAAIFASVFAIFLITIASNPTLKIATNSVSNITAKHSLISLKPKT